MSEPWLDSQGAGTTDEPADEPRFVEPLELPAAGGTSGATRPSAAPVTDALSIEDAAARYGVSTSTIRRRLQRDEIAGAFKVTGPKGEEWRLPHGALEALGYRAVPEQAEAPTAPTPPEPPPELQGVLDALERVTSALADERRQLMAATEDRGRVEREREDARVKAARLEAQLAAERERRHELEQARQDLELRLAEVEAARSRRRWWRR